VREIPLTKGYSAIVDDEDYNLLNTHRWKANVTAFGQAYAMRAGLKMHRVIMNAPKGMVVDHINGNTLDNRKENLRVCEQKFNARNRCVRKTTQKSSRFKGVHLDPSGLWVSGIRVNGRKKSLGYFNKEIDAALAYNQAALEHFGEYAQINDPSLLVGATACRRIPKHDGIRNGRAKLNSELVAEIRNSTERTDVLAAKYGVGKSTIIRARSGECWSKRVEP
jgi:hypothetical protein